MQRFAGFILGMCLAPLAGAAAQDSLWEITTRMEMPDMPPEMKGMKIPGFGSAQKHTVCLAEGKNYESEQQKDCKVLDQKQSGKITRMTIQCKDGTMKMEREELGRDHWRARMEMTSTRRGSEGQVTMIEEAKRVGGCDAAQEGNLSRETQKVLGDAKQQADASAAALGKECQQAAADWPASPQAFGTYDQLAKARQDALARAKGSKDAQRMADATNPAVPGCAAAKADYCAKSKAAFSQAGSRPGYSAALKDGKADEISAALAYCGKDLAPLTAKHCKAAQGDADYAFIAAHCPAERKVLAKEHCAGRAYTAVEPKYRALCGGGSGEVASTESSPGARDIGSEAVEQGVKKLKGLFGF